jgi:hypothetical protein
MVSSQPALRIRIFRKSGPLLLADPIHGRAAPRLQQAVSRAAFTNAVNFVA